MDKSLPYGMPYAQFIKRACFHNWQKIPYRREERAPIFGNRDKWQCSHCKHILWSVEPPPPDYQVVDRVYENEPPILDMAPTA